MIKVVCALIKKDGKVLLTRRKTGDESVIGKWEFPGGKVETDETDKDAIEREIKEELEINVRAKMWIAKSIYKYPNKTVDLNLYECDYLAGTIKLHDHIEYAWVNTSELLDYDLANADIPLIKYL